MEPQTFFNCDEAYQASLAYFAGDEKAARMWVNKYSLKQGDGHLLEKTPSDMFNALSQEIIDSFSAKGANITVEDLSRHMSSFFAKRRGQQANTPCLMSDDNDSNTEVIEVRPQVLECDVVRFQNNKEKWVALVGLLNGYPYEIFTGLLDDEEGIMLPKSVSKGKIVKQINQDGSKRYDFQFENTRGYKITVEGLSERFNPEYWNYAKLISGVLRYRMPIKHVIKLVSSLSLNDESINTWKNGVERALKKYLNDGSNEPNEASDTVCPQCGHDSIVAENGSLVCKNCGYSDAVDR